MPTEAKSSTPVKLGGVTAAWASTCHGAEAPAHLANALIYCPVLLSPLARAYEKGLHFPGGPSSV